MMAIYFMHGVTDKLWEMADMVKALEDRESVS
jgi:hypothetical protein